MIRIDKWLGLITNASQFAIPPGSTVEQVNIQCLIPGQMTVRSGMQSLPLPSGASGQSAIIRAVRFEFENSEQLMFQDAGGHIYSSTVTPQPDSDIVLPPPAPTLRTAVPGGNSITVSLSPPQASVTGYAFQVSLDSGVTWKGAGTSVQPDYAITGLTNNQAHYVRAAAIGVGGTSAYSAAFGPITPSGVSLTAASAPTVVSATATAPLSAEIIWKAPASNGGSAITQYKIQASSDNGANWTTATTTAASSISATLTGLTANTTYRFRVLAATAVGDGQSSAASVAVSVYGASTAPSAPQNASGLPTTTTIVLSWQAPATAGSSAVIDYSIKYSSGGASTTVTTSNLTYTLSGLSTSTAYSISIAARNTAGVGEWANLPTITTQATSANTAPSPVRDLTAEYLEGGWTIRWTAPSTTGGSAILRYEVTKYVPNSAGTFLATLDSPVTALTTSLVLEDPVNSVRKVAVVAVNAVGSSAGVSHIYTVTQPPGSLMAAPTVVFSKNGDGVSVSAKILWGIPNTQFYDPAQWYEVSAVTPSSESLSVWTKVSAGTLEYTFPDAVTIAASYKFGVRAKQSSGYTATQSTTIAVPNLYFDPRPSAPRNLAVVPEDRTLTVSWDEPSSAGGGISGYYVEARAPDGVKYIKYVQYIPGARSVSIGGLVNGVSYIVTAAASYAATATYAAGKGLEAVSGPSIPYVPASAPIANARMTDATGAHPVNLGSGYWLLAWRNPLTSGGLPLQKYGVRTNVGLSGPFEGMGFAGETDGIGPKINVAGAPDISASGNYCLLYLHKSTAPGQLSSAGTNVGRFDLYAVTAAGPGAAVTFVTSLPESTTPPILPALNMTAGCNPAGTVYGTIGVTFVSILNTVWKASGAVLEWSYDGVEWFQVRNSDIKDFAATDASVYFNVISNVTLFANYSFTAPYAASFDPLGKKAIVIKLRATPKWTTRHPGTEYDNIPYTQAAPKVYSVTVNYTAPGAPTLGAVKNYATPFRSYANSWALAWTAPSTDGGAAITGYSVQIQNPSTGEITTIAKDVDARSHYASWTGTATLRWRVGATNAIGTTYSSWQNVLSDNESIVAQFTVPGTTTFTAPALAPPLPAGKYRIFADGLIKPGFQSITWGVSAWQAYSIGPNGDSVGTLADPQNFQRPAGCLMRQTATGWTVTGYCEALTTAGGQLSFAILSRQPSNVTGAFDLTIVRAEIALGAPQTPTINVNGSTVFITVAAPADLQGLTLTQYRVESSLDNATWEIAGTTSPGGTGASFELKNQPAGTVYYRVCALANSLASAPALLTKNDSAPSAPSSLVLATSGGKCVANWTAPAYDGGLPVDVYQVDYAIVPLDIGPAFAAAYWRSLSLATSTSKEIPFAVSPTSTQCWVRVAAKNQKGLSPYIRKQWLG